MTQDMLSYLEMSESLETGELKVVEHDRGYENEGEVPESSQKKSRYMKNRIGQRSRENLSMHKRHKSM